MSLEIFAQSRDIIIATVIFVFTLCVVLHSRLYKRSGFPMPPGPPSDSIFGASFKSELYVSQLETLLYL